jgi:uncharacterized protein YbbC (DUF1343 family)
MACYPRQGHGWKNDAWQDTAEGFLPSRNSIGHTGWTGTSLWIDRGTGLFVVLLANTCHPSRSNRDTDTLRTVFHKEVARRFYPSTTNTHTGLDRLVRAGFEPVAGKRVALLAHGASVDQFGRPILNVLALNKTVNLCLLYTPEHGFSGKAEAGEKVKKETTGVQTVSLYGDRRAPSEEELKGIDLFVVDLQDVGARYYTYVATMLACLKACAAAGKPVLILDRPNPVGGTVLEGPIATETGRDVCWGAVPVRHGLTIAELAMRFAATEPALKKLKLTVSDLDAWPRERLFAQCALPWVPPSPNIPTPETALLYVGMCLFEGTNLNEGRGTDTPFHLIGAPWLKAEDVVRAIADEEHPGCALAAVRYTPRGMPGKAAAPRYKDENCAGIRVKIEDPGKVRAFTVAVALLSAIRKRHPKEFKWEGSFDVLAGTPALRASIERGDKALDIVGAYAPQLDAFDQHRRKRYEL